MKVSEQRKLKTAIGKLVELQTSVVDRLEKQHITDALEHLQYAAGSEWPVPQPMPHNAKFHQLDATKLDITKAE